MNKGIAIFLCDITGVMGEPWVNAGYDIILVDPQHPEGVNTEWSDGSSRGSITKVGYVIDHPETWKVLLSAIQSGRVEFVCGFPPCTDVAVSGTPQFARKFAKDRHYQAKAALIAEQCQTIGKLSGAKGFWENPISVLSSIIGKPSHIFHPFQYTGFSDMDNYFKATCIWPFNGFVMPIAWMIEEVKRVTELVASRLGRLWSDKKKMVRENADKFTLDELSLINDFYPDDRIHKASPGQDRANFRSATPRGFAQAVFLANANLPPVS